MTLALIIIISISTYFAFFQQTFVSSQEFEKYAQTLISNYNKSINFFYPITFNSFDFYSNQSYTVTAFLSPTYGSAIYFEPSENWSFKTVNVEQRIEDAIFDNNNSLQLTKFLFQGDNTGFLAEKDSNNSIVDIGMFAESGSTVFFKNVKVNSVIYNCLIIKGSNQSSYWDNSTAIRDSGRIFDADLSYALGRSEEVRERYAEPELSRLIAQVKTKWANSLQPNGEVIYSLSEKEHDIKQIEEIARTKYKITNSSVFVNSLLDYLSEVQLPEPTPTKTIFTIVVNDDSNNWTYVIICSISPSLMYLLYMFFDYVRKKRPSESVKYWVEIVTVMIIVPFSASLFVERPYDYHIISLQTALIVIFGITISIIVQKSKTRLLLWFVNNRENRNQSSEQKINREALKAKKNKK